MHCRGWNPRALTHKGSALLLEPLGDMTSRGGAQKSSRKLSSLFFTTREDIAFGLYSMTDSAISKRKVTGGTKKASHLLVSFQKDLKDLL